MDVSEQLRRAVKGCGMTQRELSRASGVVESQLSRFLAGGELRTRNVDRLCRVLGLVLKSNKPGAKARKGA
jgi:transcriptional regulator with XRE-family HTH domain